MITSISHRRAGFTLVETLAALLIFAVGLLGAAALLASTLAAMRAAASFQAAVVLGDDMASRLRALGRAADLGTSAEVEAWRQRVARELPLGDGSHAPRSLDRIDIVRITVRWDEPGAGAQRHVVDVAVPR